MGDEATMLLTVSDFEDLTKRTVPPREGLPIVALDLGSNRSWCAALALYRNGRVEARAVAPGIPGLASQEERDNVPRGTYQKLANQGVLIQAAGLRVPRPRNSWRWSRRRGGDRRALSVTVFDLTSCTMQEFLAGSFRVFPDGARRAMTFGRCGPGLRMVHSRSRDVRGRSWPRPWRYARFAMTIKDRPGWLRRTATTHQEMMWRRVSFWLPDCSSGRRAHRTLFFRGHRFDADRATAFLPRHAMEAHGSFC